MADNEEPHDEVSDGNPDDDEEDEGFESDFSNPESDLDEDLLDKDPTSDTTGKNAYLKKCAELGIIPVSAFLKTMSHQNVSLRHYGLGKKGAIAVAECIKANQCITSLDLGDNWIQGEGGEAVALALLENTTVTDLDLSNNKVGTKGGVALSKLLATSTHIRDCRIQGNNLNDDVAVKIADSLIKNMTLTRLDLSYNQFGEKGAVALGDVLCGNQVLKDLSIAWNTLNPKGGVALAEGIRSNESLTSINMSWNGIGDSGAVAVGDALASNKTLRHIDISHNRISGEEGAKALAEGLRVNRGLVSFVVGSNPLGPDGGKTIMDALRENVSVTNVGMTAIECSNFWELPPKQEDSKLGGLDDDDDDISKKPIYTPPNPTGKYVLNLSKPWERWVAERLQQFALTTTDDVDPVGKLNGKEYDIRRNWAIPDAGVLEVAFVLRAHPSTRDVLYELDLAIEKERRIAERLRHAWRTTKGEELREIELDGQPFRILPGASWSLPVRGLLSLVYSTEQIHFREAYHLSLSTPLDHAVAEVLRKRALLESRIEWQDATLNDKSFDIHNESNWSLPDNGNLNFIYVVSDLQHVSTVRYTIKLSGRKTSEGDQLAEDLLQKMRSTPGVNWCNTSVDGSAVDRKALRTNWSIPSRGELVFDYVTVRPCMDPMDIDEFNILYQQMRTPQMLDAERLECIRAAANTNFFTMNMSLKLVSIMDPSDERIEAVLILLSKLTDLTRYKELEPILKEKRGRNIRASPDFNS
eukprot:Rmarinus@m.12248